MLFCTTHFDLYAYALYSLLIEQIRSSLDKERDRIHYEVVGVFDHTCGRVWTT